MKDCDGKVVHELELIEVVNLPEFNDAVNFWVIFDCLEVGIFVDFILKHVVTNEIRIVSQKNIKRTY